MNEAEVSKQVQQMVQFIHQEAEEKANEISVAAEEEFNIEKLQLLESEKRKIRQEYERKEKQVEIAKKIDYSKQLNASRLKVLQAQDEIVNSLKAGADIELAQLCQDHHKYKPLLKDLIAQTLLRLKEPAVILRCREVDLKLVEGVVEEARRLYADRTGQKAPHISVDNKKFLPPPPGSRHSGPSCSGGVVVASKDGRVVCSNTLDARLEISFHQNLPTIRKTLFKSSVVS